MSFKPSLQIFSRPTVADIVIHVSTNAKGEQANSDNSDPMISADGRYALFTSGADNLAPGNPSNTYDDIFCKDLLTGAIMRVSTASDGTEAEGGSYYAQFSPDGRSIFFDSDAINLVPDDGNSGYDIFRKDLITGILTRISTTSEGEEANSESRKVSISTDGRYVVFQSSATNLVSDDSSGVSDIFRKDLLSGAVVRVSTTDKGEEANEGSYSPKISVDGRYVVFESNATNLVSGKSYSGHQVYRKDLVTSTVVCVSTTADGAAANNQNTANAQISADGRYVVFESGANNLVPNDGNNRVDIFRKDLKTGTIVRVSATDKGEDANGNSSDARVSADGRYVLFTSYASNLVPNDTSNGDIFRKDLVTGTIERISVKADGSPANANGSSNLAHSSPDGRYVVFDSDADDLAPSDTDNESDIFRVDTLLTANRTAVLESRFAELTLSTGSASRLTLAWGDGSVDTLTPVNGSVHLTHAYAAAGVKAVTVTAHEGSQSWAVPYRIDLTTGTMTRDVAKADKLTGSAKADRITGDKDANILFGLSGNDTLRGHAGKDAFVFNSKLGTAKSDRKVNFDTLTDFNVRDDTIWLDNAIFKKLGKGAELKPGRPAKKFFTIGDKAKDKDDYLIYNKKTGVLSYDADGSGSKAPIEFAKLAKNLKMTAADFLII